jgi:Uma2 family endonuclease
METLLEEPFVEEVDISDEKMSSLNHSDLKTRLGFLLMMAYRHEYSIMTELDFEFASGRTRPDLAIMPKHKPNWLVDQIRVQTVPITTIEILSPEQTLHSLTERIYQKHFPAGVKTVWLVVPTVQTISILLPDSTQLNFSQGLLTDPVTNLQLTLSDVFEG